MKERKSRNDNNEQLQNLYYDYHPNSSMNKCGTGNNRLKKETYIDISMDKNNFVSYEIKQKEIDNFYTKQTKSINGYQNSKNETYVNVVKNQTIKKYVYQFPYKSETLEIQKISKRTFLSSTKAKYHSTKNIHNKKGKIYLIENRKELVNEERKNNDNNKGENIKNQIKKKEIIINDENNNAKNIEKIIKNKIDKKNKSHYFHLNSSCSSNRNIFKNRINKLNLEENKNSENNNRDRIFNSLKEINLFLEDNYSNKILNKEKSQSKFNYKINKIKKILKKNSSCPSIHSIYKNEESKALNNHFYTNYFNNKNSDKRELHEKKNLKTNNNRKYYFDLNSKFVGYNIGDRLNELLSKIPRHSSRKDILGIKKYSDFSNFIEEKRVYKNVIEQYRSKKSSKNRGIMPPNNLGDVLLKQGIDFFSK